ncbi:MAG: sigma-70 family RNA polymerase sigma factor [Acidobacteriota bacterium]
MNFTHAPALTRPTAASAAEAEPEPDSFARLVDLHKDAIVNYLTRLTGQRDRAEDVAQETFVRFYQNRHRYREEGTLRSYLLRIATNLVRSEERRRSRWRLLEPIFSHGGTSPDGVHSQQHPHERSPQVMALACEEQREVSRAIAELPLTLRAPLVLREIEGLAYQEIAEILELNGGTVKSRLWRAREALKKELEPYWKGVR